jgi:hypothetical protein
VVVDAKRDVGGRVLASTLTVVKIRDDVEDHPAPVEYTIGRDLTGVPTLSANVMAEDRRPLETRILEALERDGPLTRNDLALKVGRSKADIQPAVDCLFAAGRLAGAKVRKGNGREYAGLAVKRSGRPSPPSEIHRDDDRDEGST